MKYHGGDDGWADVLAQAKANPAQPAGFTIKPAPTPAEQAHNMAIATRARQDGLRPVGIHPLERLPGGPGSGVERHQGQGGTVERQVIKATATEFDIAGSLDDIEAKKADITLTFEDKVPLKLIPKEGASLDFQGEPASYTPKPLHDDDGERQAAESRGPSSSQEASGSPQTSTIVETGIKEKAALGLPCLFPGKSRMTG